MSEPIEEYLDGLYGQLRTDPRSARRLLDEAADHLHGAAAEFEEQGMTASMPSAKRCGASVRALRSPAPTREVTFPALVFDTGKAVTLLGGIGLVAIGVSGLLAGAMAALFGRQFVGGGLARSVFGGAPASVAEDAGDAVSLRVLAGLVGLVVLAGLWALRRARPQTMALRVLPAALRRPGGPASPLRARRSCCSPRASTRSCSKPVTAPGFFLSGAVVVARRCAGLRRALRAIGAAPPRLTTLHPQCADLGGAHVSAGIGGARPRAIGTRCETTSACHRRACNESPVGPSNFGCNIPG